MLVVAAGQLGDPVALIVLMKACDRLLHVVERTEITEITEATASHGETGERRSLSLKGDLRFSVPPCVSVPSASFVSYSSRFDAVSQVEFVQRLQSLPTNIFAACLSALNCHRSQFEATFANSPPPG
jgi:hypothetical protein